MEPDRILKDIPIYPGAVRLDAFGPDSEGQLRLELPNGIKPKWARNGGQVHIRNNQPNISGYGPAPTGRRHTAGEASTRSICFLDTDPSVPEF